MSRKPWTRITEYMPGQKVGVFTIVETPTDSNNAKVVCPCGNIAIKNAYTLRRQTNCSACKHKTKNFVDAQRYIGTRKKELLVVDVVRRREGYSRNLFFKCKCNCGVFVYVQKSKFLKSATRGLSCRRCGERPHKLSSINEARTIRQLHETGVYSAKEIAGIYNISMPSCYEILSNKAWKEK